MDNTYILIMAGGVGSRFWPESRESRPKQFIDILGTGKSFIQMTYERALTLTPSDRIFILTNTQYTPLVKEHLPALDVENIIEEPSRNNTAPTIALASLMIRERNPNAVVAVMPSDHIVLDNYAFKQSIRSSFTFANKNEGIVTLGMKPHRIDTGYGYIQLGKEEKNNIFHVEAFKEKPSYPLAEKYIEAGNYVWNAGIFIFSISTILKAFQLHAPDIIQVLEADNIYGTEKEKAYILEYYPKTPSISIDFAIMEKAENIYCLPVDIGWSDLGTWNSIYDYKKLSDENVILSEKKHVYTENASNNLISIPKHKTLAISNLSDFIIVDTGDVLLIWPRKDEQEIKRLRSEVGKKWDKL